MISLKSRPTQKILNYYFLNPHAKHYINELARLLELDPKNADTKLKELEKEGLLQSEFQGKQRYFFLAKSPLVKTYKELLAQTSGLEAQLRKVLVKVPGLEEAHIFGSYSKNTMTIGSDIDLLAIGSHATLDLQKAINPIQKHSGREINVVNMSRKEFEKGKKNLNPFLANVFKNKTIQLL